MMITYDNKSYDDQCLEFYLSTDILERDNLKVSDRIKFDRGAEVYCLGRKFIFSGGRPMKTLIFKNYEEFMQRKNKNINGVSEEFAKDNPNYEEDNDSNYGCWNCKECSECVSCIDCTRCAYCNDCTNCDNCYSCDECDYCKKIVYCENKKGERQ